MIKSESGFRHPQVWPNLQTPALLNCDVETSQALDRVSDRCSKCFVTATSAETADAVPPLAQISAAIRSLASVLRLASTTPAPRLAGDAPLPGDPGTCTDGERRFPSEVERVAGHHRQVPHFHHTRAAHPRSTTANRDSVFLRVTAGLCG